MNTVIALSECFKRDKSFVATAQNDGEFNEDIIQAVWICLTYNHNKD